MKNKGFFFFIIFFFFQITACAAVGEDISDIIKIDTGETFIDGDVDLIFEPEPAEIQEFPDMEIIQDLFQDQIESDFIVEHVENVELFDSQEIMDYVDSNDVRDTPEDVTADDISSEDTSIDPGPGTCTPSDLPVQVQCTGTNKCTLGTSSGCTPTAICDVSGPQGENQVCTGSSLSDNCAKGYVCLGDGVSYNCRKFCSTDSQCISLGVNSGCQVTISTPSCPSGLTGVKTCTHHCDYFYQTGCQSGQACRFLISSGRAYSDCTAAGAGRQGSLCPNGDTDCAAGYECFQIDYGGGVIRNECAKICNYSGGYPSCDPGTTCAQGSGWPYNIGACVPYI